MENKSRLIIIAAVAAVIFGGSYYLYGVLSAAQAEQQKAEPALSAVEAEATEPEVAESETAEPEASEPEDDKIQYIDVEFETMDGNKVMLSDYVGKDYVVINFWATWCGPCKAEMPGFYNTETEYADKNVVFLMVNLTDGIRETKTEVEQYLTENELAFKNVLLDVDGTPSNTYGISSIPTTLFIDLDGNIVSGWRGTVEEDVLQERLDEFMGL